MQSLKLTIVIWDTFIIINMKALNAFIHSHMNLKKSIISKSKQSKIYPLFEEESKIDDTVLITQCSQVLHNRILETLYLLYIINI